jgi:hypothetical protein
VTLGLSPGIGRRLGGHLIAERSAMLLPFGFQVLGDSILGFDQPDVIDEVAINMIGYQASH